jgi:hypothetical protein
MRAIAKKRARAIPAKCLSPSSVTRTGRLLCRSQHDRDRAPRLSQCEAMLNVPTALDRARHDGGIQRLPSIESLQASAPLSELHLQLIKSTNIQRVEHAAHSITHGDARFAYFNKSGASPGHEVNPLSPRLGCTAMR